MSVFRPTKIEWWTFWLLMPIISIGTSFLLFGQRLWNDLTVLCASFLAVYGIGFISWYVHVVSMHVLAELFPKMTQTIIRLVLLALTHLLLITLTMFIYFYGFEWLGFLDYKVDAQKFRSSLWIGMFLTLVATSLWQVEYIFNKWKDSLSEKELIEQQRLVQEYENLKKQINPHFLFNNLNILSSLITDDPKRAEFFLNELAKVYRYMLRNNEDGITELREELNFITSYFALLKIRHNDAIQLRLNVNQTHMDHALPAFSLQLLVENAVKHNVATKASPLVISIVSEQDATLKVSNNLQRKKSNILSNNIGLSNISENYRLLLNRDLQLIENEKEFAIILPLIKFEPFNP